ncbi:MAG TPA: response regulator [Anaerovoracaceae bacterium]|nr:response regulator [Anaerovoracaceae bacterium]
MKEIKVLIVDDSPFSVGMISNILTNEGFRVVGSANCLKEAEAAVIELKPDLVTMDMIMPGADGIMCTEAIHKIDPNIKVIIVSSMMDDEIVRRAKKVKVAGYIQKPVDADEIALLIKRVMAEEELFDELDDIYYGAFKESLIITLNKFFKEVPEFREELKVNDEKQSRGFTVVMGIIGKYGGRMLLDMSGETARSMAVYLIKEEELNSDIVINVIAEISNIISGNACSMINKTNNIFGLRVSPPTTVYGESIKISKAELDSLSSVIAETSFGDLYMNIGFSRSQSHE